MRDLDSTLLDLAPPDFAEGLDDWSSGDGTPDSATYESASHVRIAVGDPDLETCLEMRKIEAIQRLRYMAEMPVIHGRFLQVRTRLRTVRGASPGARIAAWAGGMHGRPVTGAPTEAPVAFLPAGGAVRQVTAVIGPRPAVGVDLVWDERVLYAHVGLDLLGPTGGVVRIGRFAVEDVTARFAR